MTQRKYQPGNKIETLTEFSEILEKGGHFYWRHKFLSAGFIQNWQVRLIINSIISGVLYSAVKIQDTKK